MAKKPASNRPSLQLLIDRDLATRFRALCLLKGTSASDVITLWMRKAVEAGEVPHAPKRTPKRHTRDPKPSAKPAATRKPARRDGRDGGQGRG